MNSAVEGVLILRRWNDRIETVRVILKILGLRRCSAFLNRRVSNGDQQCSRVTPVLHKFWRRLRHPQRNVRPTTLNGRHQLSNRASAVSSSKDETLDGRLQLEILSLGAYVSPGACTRERLQLFEHNYPEMNLKLTLPNSVNKRTLGLCRLGILIWDGTFFASLNDPFSESVRAI